MQITDFITTNKSKEAVNEIYYLNRTGYLWYTEIYLDDKIFGPVRKRCACLLLGSDE